MDERFIFQAFEQMGESVIRVKLMNNKQSRWGSLFDGNANSKEKPILLNADTMLALFIFIN